VATEDIMNIRKSLPALKASLATQPDQKRIAAGISGLFDSPPEARQHMKLWRQARRARQEWREQRYTRLFGA
jgi:hypothetical protein